MTIAAWLILWLPFIVAVVITLGCLNKPKLAGILATGGMLTAFVLTCALALHQPMESLNHTPLESSLTWIKAGSLIIEFGVLVNGLTLLMLFVVTGIGSLIFLYSISYMSHEKGVGRYFASLSLFAFSMLGIVLSNNLIGIFIFWELVGLSSYLLIGFWFEKESAAIASKKAFLTTRVGDVGMMIGILLLFSGLSSHHLETFNFLQLESRIPLAHFAPASLTWIALLIFCGVMGKSAQVPLHVWLPDAMEGPTPVSALMHAATMVAAGVFLLARFFFLFEASPQAMHTIAWIGVITAFIPGTIALVQSDIKKILAYSTLSQLGYMVMAIGLGSREAGMFHLTTHAFFKALLFLGAGSLIHGMHTQDIWQMSKHQHTLKAMPVTGATFLIGTLALMGIPPLSGFFSKEEILVAASHGSAALFMLALTVVFLTAFYMGRLCTIVFFSQTHHDDHPHAHESDRLMLIPLVVLALFSVISGYFKIGPMLGAHEGHASHGPAWLQAGSIALALAGFISAYFVFRKQEETPPDYAFPPSLILHKKYFFDDIYDALIRYVQENIARLSDLCEKVLVVRIAVNGTAFLAKAAGRMLCLFQTGMIQFYTLVFSIGVTVLLYILILR